MKIHSFWGPDADDEKKCTSFLDFSFYKCVRYQTPGKSPVCWHTHGFSLQRVQLHVFGWFLGIACWQFSMCLIHTQLGWQIPSLLWRFLGLSCYTKRENNIDVDEVTGIGLKVVPYIKKYLVAGGKFGAFSCCKQISYFNFTSDFRNKKIGPTWKIKNLAIFKN